MADKAKHGGEGGPASTDSQMGILTYRYFRYILRDTVYEWSSVCPRPGGQALKLYTVTDMK